MKIPVLLPNIFNYPFTYDSDVNLQAGDYVIVPFGKLKMTGVVWDHFEKPKKIPSLFWIFEIPTFLKIILKKPKKSKNPLIRFEGILGQYSGLSWIENYDA